MKCPICGNKLEIKNKQIGTDNSGDPVFNEYAVCRDCKKQWNLDKQREKKQRQRHLPKKPKRQIRPAAKKRERRCSKKRRKQNQKGAQRAGSSSYRQPQKTRCCRSFPKSFRPGEVTCAKSKTAA